MHDDSVLVAVEAALPTTPRFCVCGRQVVVAIHDDAVWVECPTLGTAGGPLAFLRSWIHDREFLVQVPEAELAPAA